MSEPEAPSCGLPHSRPERILLAHGGGGRMMQQLIREVFVKALGAHGRAAEHDAAVFAASGLRLAFTTDSYVVKPLFFPGGDIGKLAVLGTVNDLAMSGARPLYLSLGVILEEGLAISELERIVGSIAAAARDCNVVVLTGDTKVVERGKADGIYLNTAGIGAIEHTLHIHPASVQSGDVVLLSGDVGRHGMAIMAAREGLEFETPIQSDCASLAPMVHDLLSAGIEVHCLRDLTRGGLATALNEIAATAQQSISVEEEHIPVEESVRGACEMLGLDPLYVANEGRMVIFVPPAQADQALALLRQHAHGEAAAAIGRVTAQPQGCVSLTSRIGVPRILDLLSGEQLPRIC